MFLTYKFSKELEVLYKLTPLLKILGILYGQLIYVCTVKQYRLLFKWWCVSYKVPYVITNWIGGLFTNFKVVCLSVLRGQYLDKRHELYESEIRTYKRLLYRYGGLLFVRSLPDFAYIPSFFANAIAIEEANRIGIPSATFYVGDRPFHGATYPLFGTSESLWHILFFATYILSQYNVGVKLRSLFFFKGLTSLSGLRHKLA